MNHSRYVQDGFSSHINRAILHHGASSKASSKAGKLRANSCAGISRDLKRQGNGEAKTNQTYGNMWFFYMICKSKMYETIEIWISSISSLSQILTDIPVEKWPIQIDTHRMLKAGGIQVVRFIISVALLRECENSGMMRPTTPEVSEPRLQITGWFQNFQRTVGTAEALSPCHCDSKSLCSK